MSQEQQQQSRRKKAVEYHFVDMNDPDRYKKIKVTRACDFCRKRKSKCDVGVPGSGTCSNCKKTNRTCTFSPASSSSPVTSNSNPPRQSTPPNYTFQLYHHSPLHSPTTAIPQRHSFTTNYIQQNPFFSIDHHGYCGYEKHGSILNTLPSLGSVLHELPSYSKQFEQELFDVYFCYVHPSFPILDRYSLSQTLRYDNHAIPVSLKWAVMSIALQFTSQHPNADTMSIAFHQHAYIELDGQPPSLTTLQTLFLLYKYHEIMTPVGMPMTAAALAYLRHVQTMIPEVQQLLSEAPSSWSLQDEWLCRASWILWIIINMSSSADSRFKELIDYCPLPARRPILTETEQYDKTELQTACNLIQLINLTLLFSRGICLISDQASLFVYSEDPKLTQLANDLEDWRSTLPPSLSADFDYQQQQPLYNATRHPSSTFVTYISLIYDILQLILAIQQPSPHHADHIVSKALQFSLRAYQFCSQDVHLSKLAFIQGSRLIAYGLTMAHQSLYYCYAEQKEQHQQAFLECRSLIFQTFEALQLIPQLVMALQTLNHQLEAKEKLMRVREHYNTPSNSTPSTITDSSQTNSSHSSHTKGDYFFGVNPPPAFYNTDHHLEQKSWQYSFQSEHPNTSLKGSLPSVQDDTGMSSIDLGPLTPPHHAMFDSYFPHTVVEQHVSRGSMITMTNDL